MAGELGARAPSPDASSPSSFHRPPTPPDPLVVPFVACEWQDCSAELVTASALLEHMYTVHVKQSAVHSGDSVRWVCRWKGCDQANKHWHTNIRSERTLLAHLRTAFERDRRWACGQCDNCAEIRVAGVVEHHRLEHDALVPSHDRGSKSGARKKAEQENRPYNPPRSGAKPRPPRYSTATGVLFTGYSEPINVQALQPKPYPIAPELRDQIVRDNTAHTTRDGQGPAAASLAETTRDDAHPVTASPPARSHADDADTRALAAVLPAVVLQPDQPGAVTVVPSTSGTGTDDAGSGSTPLAPGPPMSSSPRPPSSGRDLAPHDDPRPPPRDAASAGSDYRALYLVEKAKYRFVLQRRDELRAELERLGAEYEAEYLGKEHALDEVLRAKFGSTAEALTRGP